MYTDQKITPYIVNSADGRSVILTNKKYLSKLNIEMLDILKLVECGLLSTTALGYEFFPKEEESTFLESTTEVILVKKTAHREEGNISIRIGVHMLTNTGEELLPVVKIADDDVGLERILWHIRDLHLSGFEMSLHDYINASNEADRKISSAKAILK